MKLEIQKYLETSSIDGLVYVSKRFHLVERTFWATALISSVVCTLALIIKLGIKMNSFPIVAYLSDTSVLVSEIYFPAVTVCPDFIPHLPELSPFDLKQVTINVSRYYKYEKHIGKRYYYELLEYVNEFNDEFEARLFNHLDLMEKLENYEVNPKSLGYKLLQRLQVIDLVTNRGVFNKLNISIPTDNFLDYLNEFEKEFLFSDLNALFNFQYTSAHFISEVLTPYGLCLTFNMALSEDLLNYNNTSDDFHYKIFPRGLPSDGLPKETEFPRKESLIPSGLKVSTTILKEIDRWVLKKHFDGYYFILHDPFELPSSSSKKFLMYFTQGNILKIIPQINTIDDSIASYDPVDRNCYLDTERKLKFFKKYTKVNCIQECLTDFMIDRCNCVEFFMIRNSTTRICSSNEKNCTENAKIEFEDLQQYCGCLQPCNYVKYDYELVENVFFSPHYKYFYIESRIQYQDSKYNPLIRKQQFNELDIVSYLGGLLGLFAGISVLSIFEAIYWFTIRLLERFLLQKCSKVSSKVVPIRKNPSEQSKKWNKFAKFQNLFLNFFKESSIHGFVFLSESRIVQRLVWLFLTIFSLVNCFFMISESREKMTDSQVVAYDDHFQLIGEIPFPAVTLVPEFTVPDDVIDNYYDSLNLSQEFFKIGKKFEVSEQLLIDALKVLFSTSDRKAIFANIEYDLRPYELIVATNSSRLDWFRNQTFIFNRKFQPVFAKMVTTNGMGYTFNLLDAEELLKFEMNNISEFHFTKSITSKNVTESDQLIQNVNIKEQNQFELSIKLKKRPQIHETETSPPSFLVHRNDEIPRFFQYDDFSSFKYGMEVDIEVIPEVTRTDQSLRGLKPQERGCYFDGEKSLKYFKNYSKSNCVTECKTNHTVDNCICFEHPWMLNDDESYCYKYGINATCLGDKIADFYLYDIPSSEFCSCLPTCDSVTYHIKYLHKFSTQSDEISINLRVNTEDAILFRRYQQFTFSDVVSYVGGLLGLFAGISMLSIVEIFYFFVIRVVVDVWRAIRR